MARLLKCPVCGNMNEKEKTEHYKNRYYCPECLVKKKEEAKKTRAKQDDWDELYEYLVSLYGHKPSGRMFKQLGEFRKPPYSYTNMGMLLTLKYFHETLNNPVLDGTGIGIIPYVYDEAKKNYIRQRDINKANLVSDYKPSKIYIKVNPIKFNRKKDTIDFSSLEGNDE